MSQEETHVYAAVSKKSALSLWPEITISVVFSGN